jgi:hypothetical protein
MVLQTLVLESTVYFKDEENVSEMEEFTTRLSKAVIFIPRWLNLNKPLHFIHQ